MVVVGIWDFKRQARGSGRDAISLKRRCAVASGVPPWRFLPEPPLKVARVACFPAQIPGHTAPLAHLTTLSQGPHLALVRGIGSELTCRTEQTACP